jgi:hypothetical protein
MGLFRPVLDNAGRDDREGRTETSGVLSHGDEHLTRLSAARGVCEEYAPVMLGQEVYAL